jgi:hypothetical protein
VGRGALSPALRSWAAGRPPAGRLPERSALAGGVRGAAGRGVTGAGTRSAGAVEDASAEAERCTSGGAGGLPPRDAVDCGPACRAVACAGPSGAPDPGAGRGPAGEPGPPARCPVVRAWCSGWDGWVRARCSGCGGCAEARTGFSGPGSTGFPGRGRNGGSGSPGRVGRADRVVSRLPKRADGGAASNGSPRPAARLARGGGGLTASRAGETSTAGVTPGDGEAVAAR